MARNVHLLQRDFSISRIDLFLSVSAHGSLLPMHIVGRLEGFVGLRGLTRAFEASLRVSPHMRMTHIRAELQHFHFLLIIWACHKFGLRALQ
jgi:hypothetical protein